jgi:small subunit ribosomal protein S14
MAKKGMIEKNRRRQKLAKHYSGKRSALKAIIMNKELPIEDRFAATLKLAEMPRNSAENRFRLRCEVSGRPRANYRKFKMSRIALRELGNKGLVPGLVKSSW